MDSDSNIHVLHDQVGSAVVDKAAAHVRIGENRSELAGEALLTVVFEDNVLVSLDDPKSLVENVVPILLAHECLELGELAGRNVDHLILAHVSCNIAVQAFSGSLVARRGRRWLVLHASGLLE